MKQNSLNILRNVNMFKLFMLVRETGLEPVRCEPHAPQTCASASSATLASTSIVYSIKCVLSIAFLKKMNFFQVFLFCMSSCRKNGTNSAIKLGYGISQAAKITAVEFFTSDIYVKSAINDSFCNILFANV